MARIIYSGLVESIRGSIAGTTFQKNAYGYTVKKKPNIISPNTLTQNRQKTYLAAAVRAWRTLDQAVRDSWDTWASTYPQYAKHNPASQLSGFAVYTRSQVYHQMRPNPISTSNPDFTIIPDDVIGLSVNNTAGVLNVEMTSDLDDESWDGLLFMSRPFSDAQAFIGSRTRLIPATFSNTDQTINISAAYLALYGALAIDGQKVAISMILFNTLNGQRQLIQSDVYTVT